MKFETEKSPTTVSGMQASREFHFEFNETMFKMLSSTTYSDPKRAIIRELACNAWDAHIMAGTKDKRFEVHLPTTHEPEFKIRDFGTGMDDEEIMSLFTMYGGSSKRDSNDTTGALGIGSKSPYSYTLMYNVISTKDGVTRTYVCHVKNGKPCITPDAIYETPDAPNGFTVQFPVKESDIWEFENKAKVALEFFDPQPVVNIQGFVAHKAAYVLKGNSWGLRKEARTAAHGYQCRAVMGNVQYQVGGIDESRTNSLQRRIMDMPIDMFFPLGSLDFQTSRESLQLSEKTVAAILGMCDQIAEEAIQDVRNKIDACKDVWEAQVLLWRLLDQTSNNVVGGNGMSVLIREALEKGRFYGKYTNFDLSESKAVINMLAYLHVNVTYFEHSSRRSKRADKQPFIDTEGKVLREDKKTVKATADPIVAARHRYQIVVKPDVLFVINDTKLPGDKYIHYHVMENRGSGARAVYLVHRPKSEPDTDLSLVVKNAKRMISDMGNPPVKLLSELAAEYAPIFEQRRPKGVYAKARQVAVLVKEMPERKRYTQTGWPKAWKTPTDEQLAAPGKKYYVTTEKLAAAEAGFADAWGLHEFVKYAAFSGRFGIDSDTPIYGVRKGSKILKGADWVELTQHVYDRVAEIMTPQKTLALSLHLTPFSDDCSDLLSHLASKQPLSSSPAQCFAVALAEAKSARFDNWKVFKWVLDFCQKRGKYSQGATMNFNEKWELIKAGYPMLQFVGSHGQRNQIGTLIDYIRQVDEQNIRETNAAAAAS